MDGMTIDDLEAAPYNPRDITDAAADGLRESIARFGDIGGITFNIRTQRLVCGHQRVKALRALGAQMINGALQLATGHRFPVRIVDWTEAEEKAANVTANNPHIAGTFNAELDALLAELQGSIGEQDFSDIRLDALLAAPTDDEWAEMFEEKGDTSAVDGYQQVTFKLATDDMEALLRYLASLDKNRNVAVVKWLRVSLSSR